MLLRNSIFSTKKFFKKTLNTFKSLFSCNSNYRRIPKTPLYNKQIPADMNKNREFDYFHGEFIDHKRKASTRNILPPPPPPPPQQQATMQGKDGTNNGCSEYRGNYERNWKEWGSNYNMERLKRDEIERKLKEIERMDKSNVEHVLDIEEIMHYYSRLTCPTYIDMVDKLFIDIYAEIFSQFKYN